MATLQGINNDNTIEGFRRGRRGRRGGRGGRGITANVGRRINQIKKRINDTAAELNKLRSENERLIRARQESANAVIRLNRTHAESIQLKNHHLREHKKLDDEISTLTEKINKLEEKKKDMENEIATLEDNKERLEFTYRQALISKGINEDVLGTSFSTFIQSLYNTNWFSNIDNERKQFSYKSLVKQNNQLEKSTNKMDNNYISDNRNTFYENQRIAWFQVLNYLLLIVFFILWFILVYFYFTLRFKRSLFSMLIVLIPLLIIPFWLYLWENAIYYTKNIYI